MRKPVAAVLTLLVGLAVLGAGCSSTPATPSGSSAPGGTGGASGRVAGAITVSAAASLTDPFKKIGDDFKQANPGVTEVRFNFDSSGTLAKQIVDGAAADGFAAADGASMKRVTDANLVAGAPTVFARNQLTIVVKKGNPKSIKTLADLTTAGTVALCGSDVPCGTYADQILATAKVGLPADKITRGQNVKAALAAVAEGDADAGIVYVTDVKGDKVEAVAIPDAQNAIATYPIAVMRASTDQPTMQAFIAYLLSAPGQATLKAAGFLPPG